MAARLRVFSFFFKGDAEWASLCHRCMYVRSLAVCLSWHLHLLLLLLLLLRVAGLPRETYQVSEPRRFCVGFFFFFDKMSRSLLVPFTLASPQPAYLYNHHQTSDRTLKPRTQWCRAPPRSAFGGKTVAGCCTEKIGMWSFFCPSPSCSIGWFIYVL